MYRWTQLVAVVVLALAPVAAPAAPDAAEVKGKDTPRTWRQTRDRLAKRVSADGYDANTPLKEALAFVSQTFDIAILVDSDAFKREGIQEPENQPVKLGEMKDVRLETHLGLILQQCQADYFIQPDGIIYVVPKNQLVDQILAQKVTVSFDRKPLAEALRQLSEQTGLSIILDERRAGDKAKTAVSADLRNLSLDAAVLLLSDLAELKTVTVDRAVYVTTRENAKRIRAELERQRASRNPGAGP